MEGDNFPPSSPSRNVIKFVLTLVVCWLVLVVLYNALVLLKRSFSFASFTHFRRERRNSLFREKGNDKEVLVNINRVYYPVSYWTEKGSRPYQEDRLDIRHANCPRDSYKYSSNNETLNGANGNSCPSSHCAGVSVDTSLYAVYDGHGGDSASQYCYEEFLTKVIHGVFSPDTQSPVATEDEVGPVEMASTSSIIGAMKDAFRSIDESFSVLCKSRSFGGGSTAVVAIIHNRQLIVGNVGDSRCILVRRGGQVTTMTDDHKPSREDEERRIKSLGGRVMFWGRWRVEGVLAVSRAIGDVSLKPYVCAEPEVTSHDLDSDEDAMFVVLATDGLFDVMSNEEVAKFLTRDCHGTEFKHLARNLCDEALLLGSQDNITIQVIDVRKRMKQLHSSNNKKR